ncbi:erythromycin esterase family protein [Jhaorihella thermophila]|uniref:Erythromycin esterase homolog n=1 Tax=Jhaorihella thermophila TaxID=488547 RepID=A0A1H5UPN3_9RHOB|nr:erythromycin esterase family protein [Jhaorihella thermophila]SEF76371.1 Erythromycin esterase homolog [Jhaorihella thermophila]
MANQGFPFADRADAGRRLASELIKRRIDDPVVLALPRGGVPVAAEVAEALGAPLDLVLVRKIGAPQNPEVALGAIVEGDPPEMVLNEDVMRRSGATQDYLRAERDRQLREMERRRERYLGSRARVDVHGKTAIVVDDGLATGATVKAALVALRRRGAARVIVAVPVAPASELPVLSEIADEVLCLHPDPYFRGVGGAYADFHQLTDEETIGHLRRAWTVTETTPAGEMLRHAVSIPPLGLQGDLVIPPDPRGIILFAHGSGSSRLSPRNRQVAHSLNELGFATLLLDLLTPQEAADRRNVFDIPLLAERLLQADLWIAGEPELADLPLGLFGASTGAAAALIAAAELGGRISAVVSRGGRPDLAMPRLAEVTAPTLLIVGGADTQVLELNRRALAALQCEKQLRIVPGAGHLFEGPGELEAVTQMAGAWFQHYLVPTHAELTPPPEALAKPPATPAEVVRAAAEPLPDPDDPAFGTAFDRFGDARVVLLGEASHGTSEFYRARAAITRRLIERHGFNIVAVEADWPDAAVIDRHVRGLPQRRRNVPAFSRFPTWMWRNRDVDEFVTWLKQHNEGRPAEARVRFQGLDIYSMFNSIHEVLAYLDRHDPQAAAQARRRYGCLAPWSREPAAYGRAALSRGHAMCEEPVTRVLVDLLTRELSLARRDEEAFFDAVQNARVVAGAERYYRAMYYGSAQSWNLRDTHMFQTLKRIMDHVGPDAKAIVWAHNSHIGDARVTDMGASRGELNIGQLCREEWGDAAALIGFGTDSGTVACASDWDGPMEIKAVRPSRPDSHESVCHAAGIERFLLDLRPGVNEDLRAAMAEPRLERYIGVIYRPETERWSHYSHAILSAQYDGFVWFDRTRAVVPLPIETIGGGEDETYPFGL